MVWFFCSLHYIIWRLYDVVVGGSCDFDAVTCADIFFAFIGFGGQSDEGYAMCRPNEWLYRLFFMGDVLDAPYPCSHYIFGFAQTNDLHRSR